MIQTATQAASAPALRDITGGQSPRFDVERVRRDFPILSQRVRGKPLVYLDNAATSQKPRAVIETLQRYYEHENANIHRGVHLLSEKATAAYEGARDKVRRWINAGSIREVIFVRGTTEAINLVAWSFGSRFFGAGDEIVVSALEHHSNIVPWQMLCERSGAVLRVIPMNDAGELDQAEYQRLLGPRVKLVAITHVSNALGTVNPVEEMVRLAHEAGAKVLIDGAQAAPHLKIDVKALDCDFYALSGHKLFAPTGSGVLYGKAELLEAMPPFQGGGDMIRSVTFEKTTYADLPAKFEAGTPDIACGIGLGAAIDYLQALDFDAASAWETELLAYATEQIGAVPGVRLIGTAARKAGVVSFLLEGVHPHDIGTILDSEGIAIRTGHHCAQPVMERLGIPATARASLAFYNTPAEIDALVRGLAKVKELFG